jgi:hypothetical protein
MMSRRLGGVLRRKTSMQPALARSVRRASAIGALALALASCGADTLITGIGNGGNTIAPDELDRVARELAKMPATPKVGSDDLLAVFSAIRQRALEGDPQAAYVLLRVAAHQGEGVERE